MNSPSTDPAGRVTWPVWNTLERVLAFASMLLLLALVLVTCVDVIGRYFFDAPLKGAFELTEVMLAALVFSALPLTTERSEHVEVDLLAMSLSASVNRMLLLFANIFSAALLATFSWRLFTVAVRVSVDGATTNALQIPLTPFAYFAAISCLVSTLVVVLMIIQSLQVRVPRKKGEVTSD